MPSSQNELLPQGDKLHGSFKGMSGTVIKKLLLHRFKNRKKCCLFVMLMNEFNEVKA